MDKFEELKEKLKELSPEEIEAIKAFLNENASSDSEAEAGSEPNAEDQAELETALEKGEDKPIKQEEAVDEAPVEEPQVQTAESGNAAKEEFPKMQAGSQPEDEETESNADEPSADFEQIIDAQKAKIAALESENAALKSKLESAFGYSAKTEMPAKVNRLYDDALDVHFHK